jgi:hypothetical protein
MGTCALIDAFPAFLSYWAEAQEQSLENQIESWATAYMAPWPELLRMQIEDYSAQSLDWRQIARDKVFPFLAERLPQMEAAHQNLTALSQPIYARAQQTLGFDSPAVFVIYVGIGCGAGWATTFEKTPAILFGLENIAENGWSGRETITSLAAHEIGHLAHDHWRQQYGKPIGSGPWWQLYEEGFAQYCQSLIVASTTWHQASGGQADWLDWCRDHKQWLAAKFLQAVAAGEPVTPFFGSWYEIYGKRETGYFLGYELLTALAKDFKLPELALLEEVEVYLRPVLENWAGAGGAAPGNAV